MVATTLAAQSTEILTRSCLGLMESRAAAASEEERPGKAAARASSGLCPSGSSHAGVALPLLPLVLQLWRLLHLARASQAPLVGLP